jgi:CheY-like chemotaxis protein
MPDRYDGTEMAHKIPSVVVIDESSTSISLYQRSTEHLEVLLTAFRSHARFLEFLSGHGADLVFVDILMRGTDGLGVIRGLRGLRGHGRTPVVVVTSKDYFQDRALARELGTLEYLVKPLRSQEIREIIRRYTNARPRKDATLVP